LFFKERDIFFIKMGKNIWREQDGKWINFARPVVIVKKFTNNLFRWVALTTKNKIGKHYYAFDMQPNNCLRIAILSQIRLYDAKRLLSKIGTIKTQDFFELKKKLTEFLQ
jgi:mRNA-degrading endonuclease toxin of MazEF toxin-antitoxin module